MQSERFGTPLVEIGSRLSSALRPPAGGLGMTAFSYNTPLPASAGFPLSRGELRASPLEGSVRPEDSGRARGVIVQPSANHTLRLQTSSESTSLEGGGSDQVSEGLFLTQALILTACSNQAYEHLTRQLPDEGAEFQSQ